MAVSTSPEGGAGTSFFTSSLRDTDAAVHAAVSGEVERLQTTIELIASENIVSRAVLEAQGSVLTNKYAEGYPGRRYYGGCENVDIAEGLAIERAIALFGCGFANVQPHSGAQANQAAFLATLEPATPFSGSRSRPAVTSPMARRPTSPASGSRRSNTASAVRTG